MSKCSDADKVTGCFIPDDGSPKESVLIHTTYNADGDPHKTYATSLDSDTIIDPSTYLGGGVLLIGDCPCVTPAQFKCLKKRDFRLFYDNGATPGSSDNDCESRLNFVRFSWNFEVIGWKTNVGTLGSGFPIPATSGWTPQLQGWVNFGQAVYPVAAPTIEHSFSFTPAPTWRAWVIEGCDPEAQFGTWTLRRDDGCIFNVYPRGYQEQITHIWCVDSLDCDGNPTQTFYNRSQDSDTNVVTWEQIETPENIDCFVDCNRELPPVILPGSESECTEKQYNLCDSSVDPQVELIVFVQECPGQDPIAFAHTLEDWNANLASSEPSPEVPEYDLSTATLVNCDTGESFELPTTECEDKLTTPFCVESQEWTYGLDNTGTTFGDTASYVLTLSDGSTLMWDQSPMSGWSEQLTHWAEEIQTAANNAGLVWFVESRFIDSFNPPNIDGTIDGPGGVASGLPGAPSQNVAVALDAGGMVWRYVNFQICPGQPVPVSAIRVESNVYGNDPYDLTTAGPVLGPVQKFEVCSTCSSCNDDQVGMNWFIYDDSTESGLREATDGEIPNCWEPCGVLSSLPPPPSSDCTFEFDTGCDNNNSDQQADYTNLVTRRVTYCSGKQVGIDFYVPDPDDISALDDYILVGEYVDCATGERIELPPPPCENSSHAGTMWRIRGDAVQEVTVDWWSPVSFPGGQTSAPHDALEL